MTEHDPGTLIAGYLDDALTDDQLAELDRLITEDEHTRRLFVHTCLHARSLNENLAARFENRVQGSGIRVQQHTTPTLRRSRSVWYAAAAALLAVALTAWFALPDFSNPQSEIRNPQSFAPVATLTNTTNAAFANTPAPMRLGGSLPPGPIQLTSGTAQIMFHSGATVDLTGPCEFEMTEANAGVLHRGTLKATVPAAAAGFTIRGPNMQVIDRGTAFTMHIEKQRRAFVHVTEGRVTVRLTPGGQTYDLTADQSGTYLVDTARFIRHTPDQPVVALPTPDDYAPAIRAAEPIAYIPSLTTPPDSQASPTLINPLKLPAAVGAMQPVASAEPINLPGKRYTIEGWLWINRPHRGTILGLGHGPAPDRVTSHGLLLETLDPENPDPRFPEQRNALRYLHRQIKPGEDRNIFSDIPYAVGRWQHVAVVCDGQTIQLYLDGQPVAEASVEHPLQTTAYLTIGSLHQSNFTVSKQRRFDGFIQHLAVYPRALPPETIARHHQLIPPKPTQARC